MTLAEFKAWFEGFTESMEGAPTEAQFERIKAKVTAFNAGLVQVPQDPLAYRMGLVLAVFDRLASFDNLHG